MPPLVVEVVGYIGRALAHEKTGELMPYVMQSTLLLLAPILFAASLYMTLSRVIVSVHGHKCSPVAPRWLTRVFVAGDVFSFIVQASGAGLRVMSGNGKSDIDPNLGSRIIVGGLIFQIIIFGFFIITTAVFNRRFGRESGAISQDNDIPWQETLNMLYVTSAFVMVRNMFRVVEYAMGSDGYLLRVEWGVYVFDASLMILTMAWYLWRYPYKVKQALRPRDRVISMESQLVGKDSRAENSIP